MWPLFQDKIRVNCFQIAFFVTFSFYLETNMKALRGSKKSRNPGRWINQERERTCLQSSQLISFIGIHFHTIFYSSPPKGGKKPRSWRHRIQIPSERWNPIGLGQTRSLNSRSYVSWQTNETNNPFSFVLWKHAVNQWFKCKINLCNQRQMSRRVLKFEMLKSFFFLSHSQ